MDNFVIVLIVIACIVGVLYFLGKKKSTTTYTPVTPPSSAPRPTTPVTGAGGTGSARPGTVPPAAPPVRVAQQSQIPRDPVITVFEDKTIRQVRRCPSCDGENPPHAAGCMICGRRM